MQTQSAANTQSQSRSFLGGISIDEPRGAGFTYRGTTLTGRTVAGYIDTPDERTALAVLQRGCIKPDAYGLRPRREPLGRRRNKVSREDLGLFANQLADRLRAGEPLTTAIRGEAKGTTNRTFKAALTAIADLLTDAGVSSAHAFRTQPHVFPATFCHILALGIRKGDPSDLLQQYGTAQIRTAETLAKLKGALIYPLAVLTVGLAVSAVLVYYVIPKMQEIYNALLEATGGQLPWLTRALLATAAFLTSIPGLVAMGAVIASFLLAIRWAKGPGRVTVQRKSLALPVVGPLVQKFNASYTLRSIGLLVEASGDINDALKQTADSAVNILYKEMILDIREAIATQGRSLSEASAPYAHLLGDQCHAIVLAGETSGRLTSQLQRYSDMLDEKIRRTIESSSRIVEPAMILIVGILIAPIVIAAYLPLFTLIGQLSNR
jgi:type IV pilus assembly protein PilC